jgi:protein disulfide-isomerase
VLSNEDFIQAVQEHFLLVKVDLLEFAKGSVDKWKERYAIEESPTLLLLTADAEEMTRVGFLPLSPSAYAAHLIQLCIDFQWMARIMETGEFRALAIQELESLYTTAKRLKCKKYMEALLQEGGEREGGGFFLLERYETLLEHSKLKNPKVQELRAKIVKSDPDNAKGRQLHLAVLEFHALASRIKKKHHPAAAIVPLLEYVRKFGKKDGDHLWRVELMIAQYLFSKDQTALAIEHAQSSYELAPESFKKEIASSIDYLKRQ